MAYMIVVAISLILLAWVAISYLIFHIILVPTASRFRRIKKPHSDSTTDGESCEYSWLDRVQRVTIKAGDDVSLCAYLVEQPVDAPWIILIHGYGSRATRMAKYIDHLFKVGYHVLAVDLRCHGDSGGMYIGLGCLEKDDIHRWIQWIQQRDNAPQIILYGTSMGAATALLCGGCCKDQIHGIISDCAPSDISVVIQRVLSHRFGWFHKAIFPLFSLFVRWFAKYALYDTAAIHFVKDITVPVLFIHGSEDGFVPPYMAEDLYRATRSRKDIVLIDQADHMQAADVNPKIYWGFVDNFLHSICG